MELLLQLQARLAEIDGRLDVLLDPSAATFDDDMRREHDALQAEREKVTAAIPVAQEKLKREQERLKLEAATAEAKAAADEATERAAVAKQVAEKRAERRVVPSGAITTRDLPPQAQVDLDAIPAKVKRSGIKNFKGDKNGRTAEQRAYRFGNWILARLQADMPGRFQFPEAVAFVNRQMGAAVNSADGTGYQYLIPEEFGTDLIDLREVYGVARKTLKIVPMSSDTRTDPRRQSGLTAYFTQEGSAGTESQKAWNDVRLTAKDLMVLSRYTNQVSADSVINVGDDLAGEIAYAFATKEDQCAFFGDGTSTYGGIQGIAKKLDDIDGAGTDSAGLVTQGTSNTWTAMVLADFHNVVGKLPQYADSPRCAWICSRPFYYTVMQKLELAAGGNTLNEIAMGDRRPRPMFLGYPVELSQVFPLVTATTGVMVILGDMSMGASFGDRQQNSISFSEHATVGGENVFERNQIAIRGTERFDINAHDVGDASNAGPIVGLKTG